MSDGTPAGILACANALAGRGGTLCPQGVDPNHQYSGLVRLTWQASPRNKLSGYYDRIHKVRGAAMSPRSAGAGPASSAVSMVDRSMRSGLVS